MDCYTLTHYKGSSEINVLAKEERVLLRVVVLNANWNRCRFWSQLTWFSKCDFHSATFRFLLNPFSMRRIRLRGKALILLMLHCKHICAIFADLIEGTLSVTVDLGKPKHEIHVWWILKMPLLQLVNKHYDFGCWVRIICN